MDSKEFVIYGALTLNILALPLNAFLVAADNDAKWFEPIPVTHTTSASASLFYHEAVAPTQAVMIIDTSSGTVW